MTTITNSRANWKPEDRQGYVIAAQELEAFAVNLRVSRAHRIAHLLKDVASVLDNLAGQKIGNDHLQVILQVVRKENHKQFRRLMTKIISALNQGGEKGRRAAKLTITRYLEILLDEPLSSVGSIGIQRTDQTSKRKPG